MTLPEKLQLLLVEDNPTDAMLVQEELAHARGAQFSVVHVEFLHEAITRIKAQRFDVVLLDLSLPDGHGLETFVRLHDWAAETPIVVLSGRADESLAIRAMQAGAQDYLVKGRMGEDVLQRSLRYAVERQRGEKILAESEERYRTLIEQSPDGYLVHAEGEIVFANTACLKLFGAERLDQLLGRSITDTVSAPIHNRIRQGSGNVCANGSNSSLEVEGMRLDGTSIALEGTSNDFLHNGRPAVQVILHNITERKRAESRFRWLVDSNGQGVVYWNKDGQITGGNDAFLRMVGYDRHDLETGNINWHSMTPPEYAEADQRSKEEIRRQGFSTPYEKEFFRKDRSRVPVLMGAAAFADTPDEGVCFMLDLTESKRQEQHSLRAQRMESIGTLAGGIAHDLNNTLGPIIMALELLKARFTDAESQELIAILSASAMRGADMVRQVLSFARGVEGRRMEVQVGHLIRDINKIATDTFHKNIQIRTIVAPDLWTVIGDPTQLHQVLLNLCVNARDAMPNGGVITISAEPLTLDAHFAGLLWNAEAKAGPYVFVQVSDTGTGIPPDVIEKIFDPFFTTKEVGKGTGLGLSTSAAILKSHGGFVRVYSELGKGTKFCVYLPAQTVSSPTVAAEREAEMPRGNGELILVVDDEVALRQITQQTLEAFGYRAVLALDGADAVAIYARQGAEIAVVLTDMMMPIMDGPATIEVLRRMNPHVKVIGASGLSSTVHTTQATNLGVKHFLPKPFTAEALLKMLQSILRPGQAASNVPLD